MLDEIASHFYKITVMACAPLPFFPVVRIPEFCIRAEWTALLILFAVMREFSLVNVICFT